MSNGTKIFIALLLVILVIVIATVYVKNNNLTNSTNSQNNTITNMLNYFDDNKVEQNKENETVENNTTFQNEVKNEAKNEITNEVVGKEEQESKNENVELNNEQKAIKLAQEEWAISISSYDFQARLISGAIYEVTVRSNNANRTTVAVYTVDTEKGTVTE